MHIINVQCTALEVKIVPLSSKLPIFIMYARYSQRHIYTAAAIKGLNNNSLTKFDFLVLALHTHKYIEIDRFS